MEWEFGKGPCIDKAMADDDPARSHEETVRVIETSQLKSLTMYS